MVQALTRGGRRTNPSLTTFTVDRGDSFCLHSPLPTLRQTFPVIRCAVPFFFFLWGEGFIPLVGGRQSEDRGWCTDKGETNQNIDIHMPSSMRRWLNNNSFQVHRFCVYCKVNKGIYLVSSNDISVSKIWFIDGM